MAALAASLLVTAAPSAPAASSAASLKEFRLSSSAMGQLRERWIGQLTARHRPGSWAPMRMELSDRDLALMGLPSAKVLASKRFSTPTIVDRRGRTQPAGLPAVASFAGAGYLGIRPGAWLLLIDDRGGVGWCSLAHVYGAPGSYAASTAGHCGKGGDRATVIAAFGNRAGVAGPVLLDFGTFKSSHDNGLGDDWALIPVASAYQHLVTPTMAFWGGPRGMFTKTGAVAQVKLPRRGLVPEVTVNPDPFLAQQIVHYGHGLGMGAGGTPRSGTAIHWGTSHYMFTGAISPGDSGSGANTLGGDAAGQVMEAAGIMTHLYIDPLMRQGIGIMGGTRATKVSGTLALGQLVGYPAPVPILP